MLLRTNHKQQRGKTAGCNCHHPVFPRILTGYPGGVDYKGSSILTKWVVIYNIWFIILKKWGIIYNNHK